MSLSTEQLEELTKQRRDTQDLDFENYCRIKKEILKLVIDVKNGAKVDESLLKELSRLENELKAAKIKTELSLDLDLVRFVNTNEQLNSHTQKNNQYLTDLIISSTKEYKQLQKRIELAQQILENRQALNKTISNYLEKSKRITLTKKELQQLFDNEDDNLQLVIDSGKLIQEDQYNPENTKYEFIFSRNSSFKLSLEELQANIQIQIDECKEAQRNIEDSKKTWKQASEKLVNLLSKIETEVL